MAVVNEHKQASELQAWCERQRPKSCSESRPGCGGYGAGEPHDRTPLPHRPHAP